MATKSILKSIHITSRRSAAALINALEKAEKTKGKPVKISRSYSEATREDIRAMFGEK